MKISVVDPKGLMADAYQMEIGSAECRSIFLDWALGVPADQDPKVWIAFILSHHNAPDHPMTDVLREGLQDASVVRRRGGRRARIVN